MSTDLLVWVFIAILSFWAILRGSSIFLNHAERLGKMVGINSFIVGAIIIGFGTSIPELVSSVVAVVLGAPEFVIATVLGSNISNILLILGIVALMGINIKSEDEFLGNRLISFIAMTLLFILAIFDGSINQIEAILLFIIGLVNVLYFLSDKKSRSIVSRVDLDIGKDGYLESGLGFLIGLTLLTLGSNYFVQSVIEISAILGIAVGILSVTAVAFGTSLPELVVSIRLATQKKVSELLGTILGSNIFNMLIITGIAGGIADLPISDHLRVEGTSFLAISSILILLAIVTRSLRRTEGVIFILLYILFIVRVFL